MRKSGRQPCSNSTPFLALCVPSPSSSRAAVLIEGADEAYRGEEPVYGDGEGRRSVFRVRAVSGMLALSACLGGGS